MVYWEVLLWEIDHQVHKGQEESRVLLRFMITLVILLGPLYCNQIKILPLAYLKEGGGLQIDKCYKLITTTIKPNRNQQKQSHTLNHKAQYTPPKLGIEYTPPIQTSSSKSDDSPIDQYTISRFPWVGCRVQNTDTSLV